MVNAPLIWLRQPHTATRKARTCESCHSDPKALGYGIQGGRYQQRYPENLVVDLELADGSVWPENYQIQMPAISEMGIDWSQIVSPEGEQLQIVGSHWSDSRPLDQDQRERMERTGVCMGCHRNMADSKFWNQEVIGKYGQILTDGEYIEHMDHLLHDAVTSSSSFAGADLIFIIGSIFLGLILGASGFWFLRRK